MVVCAAGCAAWLAGSAGQPAPAGRRFHRVHVGTCIKAKGIRSRQLDLGYLGGLLAKTPGRFPHIFVVSPPPGPCGRVRALLQTAPGASTLAFGLLPGGQLHGSLELSSSTVAVFCVDSGI